MELIRHKDGSIVSISRISEVIVSKCSTLMLCCETCSYKTTVLNKRMRHFPGVKTYSDL